MVLCTRRRLSPYPLTHQDTYIPENTSFSYRYVTSNGFTMNQETFERRFNIGSKAAARKVELHDQWNVS